MKTTANPYLDLYNYFSSLYNKGNGTAFTYIDEVKEGEDGYFVNIFLPGRNTENTKVVVDNRRNSSFDLKISDKASLEQVKNFNVAIPNINFDYNSFKVDFKDGILKIKLAEQNKQEEKSIIELV